MNIDAHTIDRIVAGVLTQLATGDEAARGVSREATPTAVSEATSLTASVVTAEVLLEALNGDSRIVVSPRAIVTPAAWDAARERRVEIVRADSGFAAHWKGAAKPEVATTTSPLLLVVRSTDAVERLWNDLQTTWRRELFGCPDEAAQAATSAICRGETPGIVIFAEQTHRAACLSNRNDRVKAVAADDAGSVRSIRKQLRANVWCVDPTGRSWFELRNLMRAIENN